MTTLAENCNPDARVRSKYVNFMIKRVCPYI